MREERTSSPLVCELVCIAPSKTRYVYLLAVYERARQMVCELVCIAPSKTRYVYRLAVYERLH